MARIFKNMADLFSKHEKNTRYTQFAKITEELWSYQVQRNILMNEQFSHDFFKLSLFPFRNYQWNGEGTHGRLLWIRLNQT